MSTQHPELFQALAEPFGKDEIKIKQGPKGVRLQYVTARSVMNRLDSVLGPENWWDEYTHITEHSAVCCLSVRLSDGQILTKCDAGGSAGMADPGDDDKSIISDAFKRAAVKFGVARHLYRDGVPEYGVDHIPAHDHEHGVGSGHVPVDCPVSGKELFRTIKHLEEQEQKEGRHADILKPLNHAAAQVGIKGRMVDWDQEAIGWAWRWVKYHLAQHGDDHLPNIGEEFKILYNRLYHLTNESLGVLYGEEFTKLSSPEMVARIKQEINNQLHKISPGSQIDSLADLKDRKQVEVLIELTERLLESRKKAQEEGAFL